MRIPGASIKVVVSTDPQPGKRPIPYRPSLRHLKDRAEDLFKAGAAASLADAQLRIAHLYGFASWPKLKAHIEETAPALFTASGELS